MLHRKKTFDEEVGRDVQNQNMLEDRTILERKAADNLTTTVLYAGVGRKIVVAFPTNNFYCVLLSCSLFPLLRPIRVSY